MWLSLKVEHLVWSGWVVDEKSEEEGGICSHLGERVRVWERMLIQALLYTLQLPQSFTLSCLLYLSCYRKSIRLLADG